MPTAVHSYNDTAIASIQPPNLLLLSDLLVLPGPVIQRTHLSGLEPPGDAMIMERMATHTPRGHAICQLFETVGLTLDTWLHQVVTADGTGVYDDVPRPEGDRGPLLHLEPFFFFWLDFVASNLFWLVVCDHWVIVHGVDGDE